MSALTHHSARHAAWYGAPIDRFLAESDDAVLGALARESRFQIDPSQRDAWRGEIAILREALTGIDGWLYLEFDIPRLGSRIDAVVIAGNAIFPIEFKIGEREYRRTDYEQAWDYGLDLKNFHEASRAADVFPLLVSTKAATADIDWAPPYRDGVRPPRRCNEAELRAAREHGRMLAAAGVCDGDAWGRAPYHPTPTIIEAARALYARHSVDSISRNDAGATNLRVTSRRVEAIIDDVARTGGKAIVFSSGVPGAGKTLVGLNVATQRRDIGSTHAVYLSGNGPLVDVLREALTRDEFARSKAEGRPERKGAIAQKIKPFIQNVHHFRDDGVRDTSRPPADHVVIFDESQRAWDREKTASFMSRRKGVTGFSQSEPEFLLSYVDRHPDWAVVVCLVGGGQEIPTGEAGIGAWLEALRIQFPHWQVHVSSNLSDSEYAAVDAIAALDRERRIRNEPDLHLSVSMRSFRAEQVSGFVKALLDGEIDAAQRLLQAFESRYPIRITRDLAQARAWVRANARGSERYGLVASSQAMRLKPHAIDVRVSIDPVHYFLAAADDTRSSNYLEDAATEFQIQGLELDWVCVTWDADLRRNGEGWNHFDFHGDHWRHIRNLGRQRYLLNAYRVLLTRARHGMVVFVPPGDAADPTREPGHYDATYAYLRTLGVSELSV